MATNVIMPYMGLTTVEGTVTKWLKAEGDTVKKDEPIVEVLTDKVNNMVEAPEAGILLKIVASEGTVVPVTQTLCWIGKLGEKVGEAGAAAPKAAQAPTAAASAAVAPSTATPAAAVVTRTTDGYVKASPIAKRLAKEHGVDLAEIVSTGPEGRVVEADVLSFVKARAEAEAAEEAIKASPLAKNLAKELGMSLASIPGTGPGGRITREDVQAAAEKLKAVEQAVPAAPIVAQAAPVAVPTAQVPMPLLPAKVVSTIPLIGLRRTIAQRMSQSFHTIPRVTNTTEADVTELVRAREQIVAATEKAAGLRISYNDLIIKVVALALRKHPSFNARLAEIEIQLLEDVNVGMATSTPNGLVVPVVHNVDKKDLVTIAKETHDKAERARKGALTSEDITGGTFTVTNLGGYEIDAFTPIINLPEVAILGIGRIVEKPAVFNGQICVRSMMWLSLTFDHRVNDGAPAAEFLCTIKQWLEKPYTLLIWLESGLSEQPSEQRALPKQG